MAVKWTDDFAVLPAAAQYAAGQTLLGRAAREAQVTTLELMQYLVEGGYRSRYSVEDFEAARRSLEPFLGFKPER